MIIIDLIGVGGRGRGRGFTVTLRTLRTIVDDHGIGIDALPVVDGPIECLKLTVQVTLVYGRHQFVS